MIPTVTPEDIQEEYTRLKQDVEEKRFLSVIEKSREGSFDFDRWYAVDNAYVQAELKLKAFKAEHGIEE